MVVLLIGLGNMGLKYLNVLSSMDEIKKIYAFDKFLTKQKNISDKIYYFNSLDNIFNKDKIDFSIICTPTDSHFKTFDIVKDFCKNIIIEKPIFKNEIECNLFKEIINKDFKIATGFIERFNPVVNFIKSNINPDQIAKIEFKRYSIKPNQVKDVGVDMDLGIHDIDLSFYILEKKFEEIKLLSKSIFQEKKQTTLSSILIGYDNLICNIHSSWKSKSSKRVIYITLKNNNTYKFDLINKSYCKNNEKIIELNKNNQLNDQIKSFIDCISGKNSIIAKYNNGIDALKVLLNENIN